MADLGWPASYDNDGNPVDMLADPLPDEPKTELGYAKRLVHVFGNRLRRESWKQPKLGDLYEWWAAWSGEADGGEAT